jgi:hypothetical protein
MQQVARLDIRLRRAGQRDEQGEHNHWLDGIRHGLA